MRSSSIKSLTILTALVVSLSTVPAAEAKPAQRGGTIRGVKTTLTQLVTRFIGRFTTDVDYPTDPIPKNLTDTSTTTRELSPKKSRG